MYCLFGASDLLSAELGRIKLRRYQLVGCANSFE